MEYVPAITLVGADGFSVGGTAVSPAPVAASVPPDSSVVVGLPLLQRRMWPSIVCWGAAQLIVERSNVPLSTSEVPPDHVLETSRVIDARHASGQRLGQGRRLRGLTGRRRDGVGRRVQAPETAGCRGDRTRLGHVRVVGDGPGDLDAAAERATARRSSL